MSVPVQVPISGPYIANGSTTQFAYQFYLLLATDLDVFVGGNKKLLNTDYTVTGVGNSAGGNVVFTVAPATGLEVIAKRNTPFTRQTDYADNGDLLADVLNDDIDRVWLALQEINANFGSSISRPVGGNWSADNLRLTMLADGTQPQDAVTYKQLFTVNGNASAAAAAAAQSASDAATYRAGAQTAAQQASDSNTNAGNSATLAQKWAANPVDTVVANGLYSAMHYATKGAASAANAATSEQNSAANATQTAADRVQTGLDRTAAADSATTAKTEADRLVNNNAFAGAISSVNTSTNAVAMKGQFSAPTFTLGVDASNPMDTPSLRQMQQAIAAVSSAGGINGVMSTFIGDVSWWQGSGALLPTGYIALNGQSLNAADYPEIVALLNAGALASVSETVWQGTANQRGKFSWTTGNTTFRPPDLNGVSSGAIQGVFLRGPADGMVPGELRRSALPNITGLMPAIVTSSYQDAFGTTTATGGAALYSAGTSASLPTRSLAQGAGTDRYGAAFNASRSSTVYADGVTEVRPPSVTGMWIMRVKGTFSAQTQFNVYTSDAALVPNAIKMGGAVRSVYSVGGVDYGVSMKSKVTTGASAVTRKALELSVDGGTGVIEITDTGGVVLGSGSSFINAAAGQQFAGAMGLAMPAGNRIVIPFGTGKLCIMNIAQTVTTNVNGVAAVTYPQAFTSLAGGPVVSNGNTQAFTGTMGVYGTSVTGFNMVATFNNAPAANATMQLNYFVMGIIA